MTCVENFATKVTLGGFQKNPENCLASFTDDPCPGVCSLLWGQTIRNLLILPLWLLELENWWILLMDSSKELPNPGICFADTFYERSDPCPGFCSFLWGQSSTRNLLILLLRLLELENWYRTAKPWICFWRRLLWSPGFCSFLWGQTTRNLLILLLRLLKLAIAIMQPIDPWSSFCILIMLSSWCSLPIPHNGFKSILQKNYDIWSYFHS